MKNHGITRANDLPKGIEITENNVFVAANIHQITVQNEEGTAIEYEFNLTEYEKNEYIELLNTIINDQSEALIELAEIISEEVDNG